MKIKKFNESVRDMMTGKSSDEVKSSLLKLTPYGMLEKIFDHDDDDMTAEFEPIAEERIKESLKELDEIIGPIGDILTGNNIDKKLTSLVKKVGDWVEKNGGNKENVTEYGFIPLSEHLVSYGFQDRHDAIVIYDKKVFDSFKELLKNFAICEVKFNNIDYEN